MAGISMCECGYPEGRHLADCPCYVASRTSEGQPECDDCGDEGSCDWCARGQAAEAEAKDDYAEGYAAGVESVMVARANATRSGEDSMVDDYEKQTAGVPGCRDVPMTAAELIADVLSRRGLDVKDPPRDITAEDRKLVEAWELCSEAARPRGEEYVAREHMLLRASRRCVAEDEQGTFSAEANAALGVAVDAYRGRTAKEAVAAAPHAADVHPVDVGQLWDFVGTNGRVDGTWRVERENDSRESLRSWVMRRTLDGQVAYMHEKARLRGDWQRRESPSPVEKTPREVLMAYGEHEAISMVAFLSLFPKAQSRARSVVLEMTEEGHIEVSDEGVIRRLDHWRNCKGCNFFGFLCGKHQRRKDERDAAERSEVPSGSEQRDGAGGETGLPDEAGERGWEAGPGRGPSGGHPDVHRPGRVEGEGHAEQEAGGCELPAGHRDRRGEPRVTEDLGAALIEIRDLLGNSQPCAALAVLSRVAKVGMYAPKAPAPKASVEPVLHGLATPIFARDTSALSSGLATPTVQYEEHMTAGFAAWLAKDLAKLRPTEHSAVCKRVEELVYAVRSLAEKNAWNAACNECVAIIVREHDAGAKRLTTNVRAAQFTAALPFTRPARGGSDGDG